MFKIFDSCGSISTIAEGLSKASKGPWSPKCDETSKRVLLISASTTPHFLQHASTHKICSLAFLQLAIMIILK